MSRVYPSSMMFQELEDILNDSATILFLNGPDYQRMIRPKMMDCMVLRQKTLNHIMSEHKDKEEGRGGIL